MKAGLESLWQAAPASSEVFDPAEIAHLPAPVRRYLERAILAGTAMHQAVRLGLRGRIRLGGQWRSMRGEEVLWPARGFWWGATVRMMGLPIVGHDACLDGAGELRWRLLGLVPVAAAQGPDVDRSAVGRLHLERVWLPTSLVRLAWTARSDDAITARVQSHGVTTDLELELDPRGDLVGLWGRRWRADGGTGRTDVFGGEVIETGSFGGMRIPTRARLGWGYGTSHFESEGVFFEAEIDQLRTP